MWKRREFAINKPDIGMGIITECYHIKYASKVLILIHGVVILSDARSYDNGTHQIYVN